MLFYDLFLVVELLLITSALSRGLLDIAKFALFGEKSVLLQPLLLLGSGMLLGTHNATPLVHHKLGLGESSRCLIGSAIVDLGTGSE